MFDKQSWRSWSRVRKWAGGHGIWTIDRGGDRKRLLEPLLERRERFVIRSAGKRSVIKRQCRKVTVDRIFGRDSRADKPAGIYAADQAKTAFSQLVGRTNIV
jgi:hypothetical protein